MLAVLAAVVGVAVYGGGTLALHQFPDVDDAAWYHDEVDWGVDRNVTGGFLDGTFRPNNSVTRAQSMAFLEHAADVLTPTFLDATDSLFFDDPLNLDADPVVCQTADYAAPSYEQQAVMMARTSIVAQNGDKSYWAYGVYSSNGGATWSNFSPGWSVESQATAAGQDISVPYMGHANLTPGETYKFGVQLRDAEGSDGGAGNEASDSWCGITVQIMNRQP